MISGTLAGRDVTAEAAHQNAVLKQARKLLGEAEAGRWLAAIDLNSREDESTISAAQRVNAACQRIAAAIDEIEQILADEKLDDAAKKAAILTALSTSLERGIATPNP
jgi:hypothetical protein